MAADIQKYRAQMFQILGFAFTTPLGKFMLDLKDIKLTDVRAWLFIYFLFSVVVAYCGILFLNKGQEEFNERLK